MLIQLLQLYGVVTEYSQFVTYLPTLPIHSGDDCEGPLSGIPLEKQCRYVLVAVGRLFEFLVRLDGEFTLD